MKKILCVLVALAFFACIFGCSKSNEEGAGGNKKISYTYDSAYTNFDQSTIRGYEDLCQAVADGTDEIRLNIGMLDNIQNLFYTSYPLSKLVKNIEVNDDGSGILITYKNEKEQHFKFVNDFTDKVNSIIEQCSQGAQTNAAFVVKLYNYIASNIVLSSDPAVSCYDTILYNQGTMFSYSGMFEYILQQKGIDAYHILAQDAAGSSWALSGAVLNGEIYYFDIMSEFYANSGTQLVYFAMTTADVNAEGLTNLTYTNQQPAADSSDLHFDQCRSCKSWEIKDNSLLITRGDDEVVEITLD